MRLTEGPCIIIVIPPLRSARSKKPRTKREYIVGGRRTVQWHHEHESTTSLIFFSPLPAPSPLLLVVTLSGVRACVYVFACGLHPSPRARKTSKGRRRPRRTRPNSPHTKCTNTKNKKCTLHREQKRSRTHSDGGIQKDMNICNATGEATRDKQEPEPPLATSMVCSGLRVSCAASRLRLSAYEWPRFGRARCA